MRNERLRTEKLRDQVELILGRDLQLVHSTSLPFQQVMDFVRELSRGEADPVHPSLIRKETGIAESTQKKLLQALEAVFMIRQIPIEGQRKGVAVFFEDQLEHRYLHRVDVSAEHAFQMAVWRNLRGSFNYETGLDWECFQFIAKSGRRRVPFAFRTPRGTLAILPTLEKEPNRQTLDSAKEFLQRYNQSLALIVTRGQPSTELIEQRILKIPAERLLFE
jgi:predicted AAA+ superfamily ATPase